MNLRPVTFHYKQSQEHGPNPIQYGLIGEEVAKVYPELAIYGKDGQIESVQYHQLPALLLNELQKQHRTIEQQKLQLQEQQEALRSLEQRLAALQQALPVLRNRR